jgi:NodT family efflux transporter outer membrane factor (OMF) lipoprotein
MSQSVLQHFACAGRFRRLRSILLGLCALLLSGCFVGLEKPETDLDIPDSYRAGDRKPDAALPTLDWWRGFRSKQLTDLIEEAQVSNLDIAAAVARIMQADAQARIAGAPLLPNVQLDGSGTRSRASQATGASTSSGGSERSTYSSSLTASYEIDFWGKNRAALLAAQETAQASRFDHEVVALTTMVSVANAYFQVVAAQDRLRVARENLAAAGRVLRLIQERFSVGTASALDIAQQESLAATQRATVPPLEQTLRQNTATLAALMGRPPVRVSVRGGELWRMAIPPVTPGLPSDLLTQRPDIREAEAQLASASANVEAARAAFLPSITLTEQGGYQSAVFRTLMRPEAAFFSLAAGLSQPIFDGLRLQGQYELQKAKQEELLQNYRRAVINAFTDVEKALIAVRLTGERERLQRNAVGSSRRAFEIAETRLREGTVDLVIVLQTQQTLFQAEDTLAQARLARLQAVVGLFQALGGGWRLPVEAPPESR